MISLKDEIKRFQNLVYNKQLGEFVTVDQMFVGGGITIESMIRESNFIVEELKKMNAVFLNYCKLNEKVYAKIVEHELNLHEEQGRIGALASSVDRKVADVTKKLKELHEETVVENARSARMMEVATEPLRKEIESKVDKVTFQAQMKKFLEEYDEGAVPMDELSQAAEDEQTHPSSQIHHNHEHFREDAKVTGEMDPAVSGTIHVTAADGVPLIKKKGKVGYDDFYKLQGELYARMVQSDAKLEQALSTATEGKQLIFKYLPVINKTATDVSIHTSEIYRLSNEATAHQNQFESSLSKMLNELNNRTNDHIWNEKLEHFFERAVKPHFSQVEEQVKTCRAELKGYKIDFTTKTVAINEEIGKLKIGIQDSENGLKKIGRETITANAQIKANYEEFAKQKQSNAIYVENLKIDTKNRLTQMEKAVQTDLKQLRKTLQSIMQTIGQTVLKTVSKKIQSQLKAIQSDIRANRDKIKTQGGEVVSIVEQVNNIKEILSRKANFSDIIQQVEKKANREDFKDLEVRLQESSQQFVSQQLAPRNSESINVSRLEKYDRHRGSSLAKPNKTLFAPRSTPSNRLNKTDFDVSTKLFMCGLEGHLPEPKSAPPQNPITQHTRRRSIKSSAGVVSDFTG